MKKSIIVVFSFLLFTQSNIFAMDCCTKNEGHSDCTDSEHKEMKMAKSDHSGHSGHSDSDSKHKKIEIIKKDARDTSSQKAENVDNTICPVTGEKIDKKTKATYEYKGKIYNFCCSACISEFKKDPEKFIKKIEEENKKKGK